MATCISCGGKGFLLMDIDHTNTLVIERCDACETFEDDNEATSKVHDLAVIGLDFVRVCRMAACRG